MRRVNVSAANQRRRLLGWFPALTLARCIEARGRRDVMAQGTSEVQVLANELQWLAIREL
jgi:hypothetical protein